MVGEHTLRKIKVKLLQRNLPKEEEQLVKDLIHQVAVARSHVDVVVNMGMCMPKEALKEEANKELAQAEGY